MNLPGPPFNVHPLAGPPLAGSGLAVSWLRLFPLVGLIVGLLSVSFPARANYYTVTGGNDNTDSTPHGGDGSQNNPYQMSSLRGAVIHADGVAGPHTISLPARTYQLTIVGTGEGLFPAAPTIG